MKVLLIVRWPVGGIRTFINYIYSSWSDSSLELHVLTPNVGEVNVLKRQLKNLNCVWHVANKENPGFKDFLKESYKVIRSSNYDLIHAHGFTSALSAGWLLPFLRCKAIFTSHDVLNASQFLGGSGKIKKILMPLVINRFNVIHSVSFDAQQNLLEMLPGIDRKKCQVILNGVDTERFYAADLVNIKQNIGVPPDKVLIGFFGRFMSQKGFKFLVEAVSQLEGKFPGKYHVACFGSGSYIREEKADIERKKLSHLFYFHDFVPDTAPYVRGCDLVAMPSLWEACGLVAMEVLTAGVPLVASDCIGLREVCKETPAILVSPSNASSLAEGIEKASEVPREVFSQYATQAKDRFSVKSAQKKFHQLYLDMAVK